jgi:peptide/nickel transport system permease protein
MKRGLLRRWPRNLKLGVGLMVAWVFIAVFGPMLLKGDPTTMDLMNSLHPPSLAFPFGTDNLGRGVFTRVIYGSRIDLQIALFCVVPAFVIGTCVGMAAGYFGGTTDVVSMRVVDIAVAFPFFVAVIAIVAVIGPGLKNMYIAVAAVNWVSYARITRSEILVVKQTDYVQAARLLGFGDVRILARHILPNVIVQGLVYSTSDAVLDIYLGSSLGWLGLGAQPPLPEWGLIISDGYSFITQAPWISAFPGLAIVLLAVSLSLLGDGLADALRPELGRG